MRMGLQGTPPPTVPVRGPALAENGWPLLRAAGVLQGQGKVASGPKGAPSGARQELPEIWGLGLVQVAPSPHLESLPPCLSPSHPAAPLLPRTAGGEWAESPWRGCRGHVLRPQPG